MYACTSTKKAQIDPYTMKHVFIVKICVCFCCCFPFIFHPLTVAFHFCVCFFRNSRFVEISWLALHAALELSSLEDDRLQSFCYVSIHYLSFRTISLLLLPEIFIFHFYGGDNNNVLRSQGFFFVVDERNHIRILMSWSSFIYLRESMHFIF